MPKQYTAITINRPVEKSLPTSLPENFEKSPVFTP